MQPPVQLLKPGSNYSTLFACKHCKCHLNSPQHHLVSVCTQDRWMNLLRMLHQCASKCFPHCLQWTRNMNIRTHNVYFMHYMLKWKPFFPAVQQKVWVWTTVNSHIGPNSRRRSKAHEEVVPRVAQNCTTQVAQVNAGTEIYDTDGARLRLVVFSNEMMKVSHIARAFSWEIVDVSLKYFCNTRHLNVILSVFLIWPQCD